MKKESERNDLLKYLFVLRNKVTNFRKISMLESKYQEFETKHMELIINSKKRVQSLINELSSKVLFYKIFIKF